MDPIQQILAQGQIAQAGEGLGQFYFEGRKSAQEDQRINLSRQRVNMEQERQDTLLPYEAQAAREKGKQAEIATQGAALDLQTKTEQLKGAAELTQIQLDQTQSPQGALDPDIINRKREVFRKYPSLSQSPGGAAAITEQARAAHLDQMLQQGLVPNRVTETGPNGESVQFGGGSGDLGDQEQLNFLNNALPRIKDPTVRAGVQSSIDVLKRDMENRGQTPQMKNAKEGARLDSIINDSHASDEQINNAQREQDLLQQQMRNNLPKTEQLQASRDRAIARGDYDSARELDNQIAAEAQKSAGRGFAPSAMGKKISEWQKALLDGDPLVINYYEKELGIKGLSAEERAQYKAGLSAINSDPTKVKAEDKQAAQEKFTNEFMQRHGNGKASDTKPALPRIGNPGAPSTPSAFQKGERRSQNGHTFQFDGSKWNVVE